MNVREELVHKVRLSLILDLGSIVTDHHADDAAHNVVALAEEHFKPRTITTAEELDALPVGSVILDPVGLSLHKNAFTGWTASNGAKGITEEMLNNEALPATVIYEGDAA